MSHTKVGWYEECTRHPQPPRDATGGVWDAWNDTHFTIGGGNGLAFRACEANRLGDICAECTLALQGEADSDEVSVPWPCPAVQAVTP